ncbi:FYN-binding protein 1 [Etheostoma spectabile]|uniref:FYN-binding protein 1 n=1 Tax=Etheostoma spectabile TaxID=54343 RepID=UPI0013AF4319|nr:FYN-binding protein 1-like [Etheostoma spectabile]
MDQEETMDFKALRAKFQEEELLLKQPKTKPVLLDKPKFVPPPPQSPPHYLPAGARTSLLTAINQNLEAKTTGAPRVVFKEDKKNPLIQMNSKGKDQSEGKQKKVKDKATKGSKEKLEDCSADQKKEKRLSVLPGALKDSTAELVPATPPPKATTLKKKGFLGFMKASKRDSVQLPADPILDTPSSDDPGPAPLIPVPSEFGDGPSATEIAQPKALLPTAPQPKALLPNIPTFPDSNATVEITPPSTIPASLDFSPPPAFIPDIPALKVPTRERTTPLELEAPALAFSRPASQNETIPNPPSAPPTPPPGRALSASPPATSNPSPSPPEPGISAEAGIEAGDIAAVATPPPPPVEDPASISPSPKAERPISALSALSRAEDMGPVKRMSACDLRIFNALEKARRKNNPPTNPTPSYSITPPPKELPPSPTDSLPDLPLIDYRGKALPPKPVNGLDHVLTGVTEEGSEALPELLVVPPPPPKKVPSSLPSLDPAPKKPVRPPSVSLGAFIPPPLLEANEILDPPEFSETDTTNVQEFDDVDDAYSPELQGSYWGNTGPDTPDGRNLPEFYGNGLTPTGAEVHAAPAYGDEYQDNPQPESSLPLSQESPSQAGLQAVVANGVYESTDNLYEDIRSSATKKKTKTDGGKKRKGQPKNPYGEQEQETNEEKSKLGRPGKSEKKPAADGPDEKELKKKEKQRLEKEKKELKEKQEREKKEQKERQKKDNDMKKKFKITGQEEAMYQAKATVTTKGRKNDLPLNSGDVLSIIRTDNCPKGKWLAKDSGNNYGYIAVDHVELDIQEMLELGKKAAITRKSSSNNVIEEEVPSTGLSNRYSASAESFSDDSEEWTADDDEPTSPTFETADPLAPVGHTRTLSMPDMGNKILSVNHQHSQSDLIADGTHAQARHEALQKLTTFFHSPKPVEPVASSAEPETSAVLVKEKAVPLSESSLTQEMDFDQTDMLILPPPDLYA